MPAEVITFVCEHCNQDYTSTRVLMPPLDLRAVRDKIVRTIIEVTIGLKHGNLAAAARALGLNRTTLSMWRRREKKKGRPLL